jgi:hypothetical protein
VEYIYKPSRQSLFLPYAERGGDVPLLAIAGMVENNSGGWDELFVETGLQKNKLKYTCKMEQGAGWASVTLTRPCAAGSVGLVRTMTLSDDSLALRMDIKVKGSQQGPASLWAHGVILPCGDFDFDDYCIIPARKTVARSPVITVHSTQLVPEDSLLLRRSGNGTSCMYELRQPWFAAMEAKKDFGFGHVIRPAGVTLERTVFSCWTGNIWNTPAMTQEIFLPPAKAGEERTFSLYITALPGMKGVSWMGADAAVYMQGLYDGDGRTASVTVLALKEIRNARLSLMDAGGWKLAIPVKRLAPGERIVRRISLPAGSIGQDFSGRWAFGGGAEDFVFLRPQKID